MDPGPAKNPQPETLGAWIPPMSAAEANPLMEALRRAAALKASGGLEQNNPNALIQLLTGRPSV